MAGVAGCVGEGATPTESFDVTDLAVVNRRDTSVTVAVQARAAEGDETVVDQSIELTPGETRKFDDPFANDRQYVIAVSTDGLDAEFDWTGERRDGQGVRALIHDDRIEFRPIDA